MTAVRAGAVVFPVSGIVGSTASPYAFITFVTPVGVVPIVISTGTILKASLETG